MISEETREDFMQSMYDMFSDDSTNDRANQIIDIFDISTENCIELPCKVGDTVYDVLSVDGRIKAKLIRVISIWESNVIYYFDDGKLNPSLNDYCCKSDFGKTVFLTPEEAEKALKEHEQE